MMKYSLLVLLMSSTSAFSNVHEDLQDSEFFVARVIFSEASRKCTYDDRFMIASTMKNRVNNKYFSNKRFKSMFDAASTGDYQCVKDPRNRTWELTKWFETSEIKDPNVRLAWKQCKELAKGRFIEEPGIVFYHGKEIPFSNKMSKWKLELATESTNFLFYRIATN